MKDNPTAFSPMGGPLCPHKKKKKILRSYEISGMCLNFIEWYPSAQSLCQMKALLILAENSWKTENKLFPMCVINISNILWVIVVPEPFKI